MKRAFKALAFSVVVIASAAIPVGAVTQKQLTLASGATAGVYHPLGNAMAKVLEAYLPDTRVVNEATSTSVDNIRRVVAGTVQIAFTQPRGGSPIPFHNGAKNYYRENGVRIVR